jgi:hypothetical protein
MTPIAMKCTQKDWDDIKENSMNRFPISLQPFNAQKIINIACSAWRTKLAVMWANNIVLNLNIEISEEFYKEMRKACNVEQNKLFDTIFGKDKKEFPYKPGDWIIIKNSIVQITNIIPDNCHSFWIKHNPNVFTGGGFGYDAYANDVRFATKEEIAQLNSPYKNGDLVWVKNHNLWELRYTTGILNGDGTLKCYEMQKKYGSTIDWSQHKPAPGIKLPD